MARGSDPSVTARVMAERQGTTFFYRRNPRSTPAPQGGAFLISRNGRSRTSVKQGRSFCLGTQLVRDGRHIAHSEARGTPNERVGIPRSRRALPRSGANPRLPLPHPSGFDGDRTTKLHAMVWECNGGLVSQVHMEAHLQRLPRVQFSGQRFACGCLGIGVDARPVVMAHSADPN